MTVKVSFFQAALFLLFLTLTSIAHSQLPEDAGKKIIETRCNMCHDVQTVIGTRRAKTAWQEVMDAMLIRGARVTDEEIDVMVAYLTKYFGVLNVNKATAKELEDVLAISTEKALAIVRYRTENGDFEDINSLKSVPGVDAKMIQEQKDRFVFK